MLVHLFLPATTSSGLTSCKTRLPLLIKGIDNNNLVAASHNSLHAQRSSLTRGWTAAPTIYGAIVVRQQSAASP
jgi:hypothetical protein